MYAAPLLAALVLPAGVPTPTELLIAEAALNAPDAADVPERSARMTAAVLAVMVRLGACDPGVEGQWFQPTYDWRSEWSYARRLVADVSTCPPLSADTLPPADWYAREAVALRGEAERHRKAAAEYRDRIAWEVEYEARLTAWAVYHDGLAESLSCRAERAGLMAGGSWQRPRRVVLRVGAE